jgi:putative glutamine amidotransferase
LAHAPLRDTLEKAVPSSPRVLFTIGHRPKAEPYLHALRQCGLDPGCRTVADPRPALRDYAGLVLGGGRDVNPRLYGELRLDGTDDPDTSRDEFEMALLGEAIGRKLPVLAICRGLQLLNVHLGGTLHQHIEGHRRVVHEVVIAPDSLLAEATGVTRCDVMSRHHQAVKDLAPGLRVTAAAPDGAVEAVQMDAHPRLLAVQWHPEDGFAEHAHDRRLFEFFAGSL